MAPIQKLNIGTNTYTGLYGNEYWYNIPNNINLKDKSLDIHINKRGDK